MTPSDQQTAYLQLARRTGIQLNTQNAAPPTAAYIGKDDQLWVMVATQSLNPTVTINYRLLMPDGSIQINQQTFIAQQLASGQYKSFPLPESFLLSIAAVSNLVNGGGLVYVELILSRAAPSLFNAAQVLAQGYTNFNQPISWPNGIQSSSVDCAGLVTTTASGVPAAGADISVTVPANTKWRFIAMRALLTSSATVATRTPFLTFDDGVNIFCDVFPVATQPAGVQVTWSWADGIAQQNTSVAAASAATPRQLLLGPGYRIRTATSGLQSGDQWNAAVILIEEWLLP